MSRAQFGGGQFNSSQFNGSSIAAPRPTGGLLLINHALSIAVAGSDGTRVKGGFTETGARSIDIGRQFYQGSTDVPVAVAWPVAGTMSVYLLASTDLTLKTNSPTSPDDVIELKAGVPLYWEASAGYFANPFTIDVLELYCSCTAAALFQGAILTL